MEFKEIKYIDRKENRILKEDVPGESFLKFLYYNPFGKLPLNLIVKRKFLSSLYGKYMDTKHSKKGIEKFVKDYNVNMDESLKSIDEFKTYNEFFIREMKKNARTIDENEDVITSSADGKIIAFENIDEKNKFFVKGSEFSLEEYLGDKELAKKYEGGVFIIIRLAPVDYHRYHFPATGRIGESKRIKGHYFSVSPHAIRQNFKVYSENERTISELKTEKFGDILISEVGATMVGGIKQSYIPNSEVKKGDEKGYFYFGGSSCILLFEKNKVNLDRDIIENSKKGFETKVFMGEKIGTMSQIAQ